jgi:hypothetical protein
MVHDSFQLNSVSGEWSSSLEVWFASSTLRDADLAAANSAMEACKT